jgi:hypothetical protein
VWFIFSTIPGHFLLRIFPSENTYYQPGEPYTRLPMKAGRVAEVFEHLPGKPEALSSNPSTDEGKK